ncbi:Snn1p PWA37_002576 [Arxiozyma heterogenica]
MSSPHNMIDQTNNENVHPVELSVYSILSSNLDGIQQSINELRESQAILIITMRKISQSLDMEERLLHDINEYKLWCKELNHLEKRLKKLTKRYSKLVQRNQALLEFSNNIKDK